MFAMQLKVFLPPLIHSTTHLKWVLNVFLPIVMLFTLMILNELRMD